MVRTYDFLIYSEVIREIGRLSFFFPGYKEKQKKVQLVGSNLFLK